MPLLGFEAMISAGERPQTYALDRAASGTGIKSISTLMYTMWNVDKYKITFKLVINRWTNEIL